MISPFKTEPGYWMPMAGDVDYWWWQGDFDGNWRITDGEGKALTSWHANAGDALAELRQPPESSEPT